MEFLEGKDLMRRMLEGYSRDPRGWSFVVSPSRSGFFDAAVTGPEGTWMLKIDSLFKPFPTVIGSRSGEGLKGPRGPFPYGYRALPPTWRSGLWRTRWRGGGAERWGNSCLC